MIKCALSLLIIATCIVGIFADEFCEKQKKLDSECAKYCYQVAKPLLQMAPVCHQKDAEIANLQKELVVYKQQEKRSLEEGNKYNVLNDKFIELNRKLAVYEDRDRKSLEEGNKCNELKNNFIKLHEKLAVYEYREKGFAEGNIELKTKIAYLQNDLGFFKERERKCLKEETKCNNLTTKLTDLQNKLIVNEEREKKSLEKEKQYNKLTDKLNELNKKLGAYEERDRKSLEEGNKCSELNEKLDKQLRILFNLEEREKKDIEEINLNKQLNVQLSEVQEKLADCEEREKKDIEEINLSKKVNVQLGEVQEKLTDCEEREKKSKEINSKAEIKSKASLEEYLVRLSKLESSNLALNISNQNVKEDLKQCYNYMRAYENTCLKQKSGVDTTGTVEIEGMEAFEVSCVNDLNSGPGWMLIQKRIYICNTSICVLFGRPHNSFYKEWSEYRDGFSNGNAGFFIGLEKLHRLTNAVPHELYIDMEVWDGNKKFAHYDNFRVGSESEQYPLKDLGNYNPDSNAGDALRDNNNMKFSTRDRDNDNSPDIHCAKKYYSGWWHNKCTKANLNGYQVRKDRYEENGVWWFSHVPLKNDRMLIRPKVKK